MHEKQIPIVTNTTDEAGGAGWIAYAVLIVGTENSI